MNVLKYAEIQEPSDLVCKLVTYSFYDFRSSENKANRGLCAKIWSLWDF